MNKSYRPSADTCTELLMKLIRTDTCQPEGNEAKLVDLIIDMLPENISYTRLDHTPSRSSLIIKLDGAEDSGGLAFIGHLDTVSCSDLDKWICPPHEPVVKDGLIYGRGSADMKGGDAAMLLTMSYIADNDITLRKPVYFCFTADEEASGIGIRAISDGGYIDDVDEVIVAEPSGHRIGTCEKGALWLNLNVQGVSCHASMPYLGVNAVEYALTFAEHFKSAVEGGRSHEILGNVTASVTKFDGGILTNIIPASASLNFDIRTNPGVSHDDIIRKANDMCAEMMASVPSLKMDIAVLNNRPALESPEQSGLVSSLKALAPKAGLSSEPKGLFFYTDASQFIPKVNVPFVIAGPGEDSQAHRLNECADPNDVAAYAQLYTDYITGCCACEP